MSNKRQVLCVILDGWGHRSEKEHNAIAASKKPTFDWLWQEYPKTLLEASGEAVGLPKGQIGNSEVGHLTIGAGRVMDTDLVRITKAAVHGDFLNNPAFKEVFEHTKEHKSTLHVLGLLSRGGVHSHEDHILEIVQAAKRGGVSKIVLHAFTDGRDTAPQIGAESLKAAEALQKKVEGFSIGSMSGRFYAMDRDKNWHRTEKTVNAIFNGAADQVTEDLPSSFLTRAYLRGVVDELLEPVVLKSNGGKVHVIEKNDGLIVGNFRADRMRQLMKKIVELTNGLNLKVATLTEYEPGLPVSVAFKPEQVLTTLGNEISKLNLTQAHIAETEKAPHVTYFVNGGRETPHALEQHIIIESRKDIKTHDEAPLMKAREIADAAIKEIEKGTNFIFVNFANPDMVGHTANVPAIIEGVEAVDYELKRVLEVLSRHDGIAFISADHGNAELNIDLETGAKHTAHTLSPVPTFITLRGIRLREGGLIDIAPTVLELLGVDAPRSMTGHSLIIHN